MFGRVLKERELRILRIFLSRIFKIWHTRNPGMGLGLSYVFSSELRLLVDADVGFCWKWGISGISFHCQRNLIFRFIFPAAWGFIHFSASEFHWGSPSSARRFARDSCRCDRCRRGADSTFSFCVLLGDFIKDYDYDYSYNTYTNLCKTHEYILYVYIYNYIYIYYIYYETNRGIKWLYPIDWVGRSSRFYLVTLVWNLGRIRGNLGCLSKSLVFGLQTKLSMFSPVATWLGMGQVIEP